MPLNHCGSRFCNPNLAQVVDSKESWGRGYRVLTSKLFHIALIFALLVPSVAWAKTKSAKSPAPARNLSRAIEKVLASPDASRAFWGIQVVSLATGKPIYSLNADKLFTPASNLKLVTTAAAFALVGPDYKFSTTVEAAALPDAQGKINGDLDLIGRGDPNLSGRALPFNLQTERTLSPTWVLEGFADQLVKQGVKSVSGDIVGDDTFYPYERYGEGWSLDDAQWYYGAPVSALSLNDNMIQVTITPATVGAPAQLAFSPFAGYYAIENHLTTGAAGTKKDIAILREPGWRVVQFWGSIPLGAAPDIEDLAVEDPAEFAAFCFKRVLETRGIQVSGHVVAQHRELWTLPPEPPLETTTTVAMPPVPVATAPPVTQAAKGVVLASQDSVPLGEDLTVINKVSQNLHAELALRLIGKLRGGNGTAESGVLAESAFLAQAGLVPDEYHIFDGSGLSREDLISPEAIVKLLLFARAQPWGAQFVGTLPVAASDGSLLDRFVGSPAAGRVHAKTGGMEHVNSLSGFATTVSGEQVAFSILVNNHHMHESEANSFIDQVVDAIVSSTAKRKR